MKSPEKFHGTGPVRYPDGDSPPAKTDAPNYQDVMGQTMVKPPEK